MRKILAFIIVAFPSLSYAAWEVNMPRGVTPTSEIAYDIHMLMFWITVVIGIIVFGAMDCHSIYHFSCLCCSRNKSSYNDGGYK